MNRPQYHVIITRLDGIEIRSVPDSGFTQQTEVAPVVHAHAFFELIVGIEGRICVDIHDNTAGNAVFSLEKGDVCLLPPGIYHSTREAADSPSKLALRFSIAADRSKRAQDSPILRALSSITLPRMIEDGGAIHKMILQIREELNTDAPLSQDYVHLLLGQLYILLFRILDRGDCDAQGKEPHPTAEDNGNRQIQIEEYMLAHFCEQLTEDDLARELYLSKRQVSRILQRLFGKSFRQMLIDLRLNRAAQLLTDTDMPIEEIVAAVGYTSLSGFYTAFRKRYSISAGEYRRTFGTKR